MKRTTALAVSVRTLSWSISSHFVAIHFWNVQCSQKLRKIRQNLQFWKFKVVQGRSRSSMLIKLKSPWPVLVMISDKSVTICNCFHIRRANSSKITFFLGVPLFDALVCGEFFLPRGIKFCHKKTRDLAVAHSEDFVMLACTVLIQIKSVTDRRTDRHLDDG